MKKYLILMLLLLVTAGVSAQKMTIKTANGQMIEISCEGIVPSEVVVINDSVVFKMPQPITEQVMEPIAEDADSVSAPSFETDMVQETDTTEVDSLKQSYSASGQTLVGALANSLAEEFSPEYAEFNREHANDHPQSEKDVLKAVAKEYVNSDVVEAADILTQVFSGLRFTKDTTFVPHYVLRKPKLKWRTYNVIMLDGSFGKNISEVDDNIADRIRVEDYGDDTSVENKFGAGVTFSHVYMRGREVDGKWVPNPTNFAVSWGGMLSYSYENEMGSYVNTMGKVGFQIGRDIALGIDALIGCGITPYNTFYTNGIYHSVLNKSAFCFKYGLQAWGSLNFTKDTYTAVYARYITSVQPASSVGELPEDWEVVLENFNPSGWTVGLAVGYKFGEPTLPSRNKRLQVTLNTAYQLVGKQKGLIVSSEIGRFTQVSPSTSINYGLAVEQMFDYEKVHERYSSVLLSAGFRVRQPNQRWFWGAKLYAGVGDYAMTLVGKREYSKITNSIKKLCAKGALQLSGGLKIGGCNEVFAACRLGGHLGKAIDMDGFDDTSYDNLSGFEMDAGLGYRITF